LGLRVIPQHTLSEFYITPTFHIGVGWESVLVPLGLSDGVRKLNRSRITLSLSVRDPIKFCESLLGSVAVLGLLTCLLIQSVQFSRVTCREVHQRLSDSFEFLRRRAAGSRNSLGFCDLLLSQAHLASLTISVARRSFVIRWMLSW